MRERRRALRCGYADAGLPPAPCGACPAGLSRTASTHLSRGCPSSASCTRPSAWSTSSSVGLCVC